MADWQERVQSMIMGFVFAYMVMKLFSVIANFRAGNMRVERASDEDETLVGAAGEVEGSGVGTDEEAEADGGDEQEARGEPCSSSDDEDDASRSQAREIGAVSGVESKGEDVEVKNEEGVEAKEEQASKALTTDDP